MLRRLAIPVLAIVTAFFAGLVASGRIQDRAEPPAAPASVPAAPVEPEPAPQASAAVRGLPDFTQVAARTIGAVTNISSTVTTRVSSPFANDPFFRHFFGDEGDFYGRSRQQQNLGSGVVVSLDGTSYILTNAHVIGQERAQIMVSLADKRDMPARLVGFDELTDLAVLQVDARDLPTIPWGDSSQLKVAEWVLAIGNPFQFNQTVTLGIISALGRRVGIAGYEDFIQTDAAINPGNSGGALINDRGQLVGINTAIFSESGGSQGIGFAVPTNLVRKVMGELIQYGEVRRGSIGIVQLVPISPRMAQQLGLRTTVGALVYEMSSRSSAYEAGLRPGDVVVSVNGANVEGPAQVNRLVLDAAIGSSIRLGIIREGRTAEIKVPVVRQQRRRAA
jgi:Do/DeqQ family serine protease